MIAARRLLAWIAALVLCSMLLLLLSFYWLTGTQSGLNQLSWLIDRQFNSLAIEGTSGSLAQGVSAERLRFVSQAYSLEAIGINSAWRSRCLLHKRVCLDDLSIDRLIVVNQAERRQRTRANSRVPGENIPLPVIDLPLDVLVEHISIRELEFQASADSSPILINDISLSGQTNNTVLEINHGSIRFGEITATLNGSVDMQDEYPLTFALDIETPDLLPDSIQGGEGRQPQLASIRFSDTLKDLTVSSDFSGSVQASMTAVLHPLQVGIPLTASIRSESLGWPVDRPDLLKLDEVQIEIDGDINDYQVSLQSQLAGSQIPDADVTLQASVNAQRVNCSNMVINTLGGRLQGTALIGLQQNLLWDTRVQFMDIDPAVRWPSWPASLAGSVNAFGSIAGQTWSVNVEQASIDGTLRGYPFALNTAFHRSDTQTWFIDRLLLNNTDNQLNVQGWVNERVNLQAELELNTPERLYPELKGQLAAELQITGALNTPDVRLNARSTDLSFQDYQLAGLDVKARIQRGLFEPSRVQASIDSARLAGQKLSPAAITLAGDRAEHRLSLALASPDTGELTLALAGALSENLDWAGTVQRGKLVLPSHSIELAAPAAIAWDNTQRVARIDGHCWRNERSSLCLDDPVQTRSPGQASISLSNYELEWLNAWLSEGTRISGQLSGTAEAAWSSDIPGGWQADIDTQVVQAALSALDAAANPMQVTAQKLSAKTSLRRESVSTNLAFESRQLGKAQLSISLNPTRSDAPMQGVLSLSGLKLDILEPLFPELDNLAGNISADGTISGRPTAPRFNGTLDLQDPVVQSDLLPLAVTGGNLQARFSGESLTLDGNLISDTGTIRVTGNGSIKPTQWYARVRLIGQDLRIQMEPLTESTINHDIDISVNSRVLAIRGNVGVPMARIDVQELPEGASTVSADVVIIEDQQEQALAPDAPQASRIDVNLNVGLGEDVRLSAYGLNARLEGDFDVLVRSPNPPQFAGEISVIDGVYKQYGQDLNASGQILFVGPVGSTRLGINAVREINQEDRTAGLRIEGSLDNPEITLFTEPSDKSQDAILSYIVLGRDISQASDQDANLLATAALALTVRGSRSLAGGIASALGVREFALETQGSGDETELLVSGRINDRLLLRYGREVFGAQDTLYLRYDLTQQLYLEAAQGAEQAVDLFYSFSF